MGLNSRRRRTRVVWGLLVALAVAATVDGALAWRKYQWNEVIASGTLPADVKDAPPQVRFARAHAQADAGEEEAALHLYRSLEDDTPLGQAARYNSANLLIRQAVAAQGGAEPGKAIPLIELAKEIYRDVLRVEPGRWDARYNLERAQRLLPDPDELDLAPPDTQRNSERAATTMRGFSPGLP
ncbi:MxaK protein [Variovorax rhizosphaerae]|uniref:MxaK protein n=1 Tax=Variovorax rhizosphaerae TaxID=1836200 RepID=A0ABU8WST4_9BURK